MKWFNEQTKVVKIILLLIPFINWITELVVRISVVLEKRTNEAILGLVLAVIPFTGMILGWVDLVWVVLYDRLVLTK